MNSVVKMNVTHCSPDSGKTICHRAGISVVEHSAQVIDFRDLEVGMCFKMLAGKWLIRKVSESGAIRCQPTAVEQATYPTLDFEGWERCYVIKSQEDTCVPSSQCA